MTDSAKSKYVDDCEFCEEFNGAKKDLYHQLTKDSNSSRIIFQKENLRVFPTLGEIVEGHLLISPTYHVTSSISLITEDKAAMEDVVVKIRDVFRKVYGQFPLFFEHGDPTGKQVTYGQCVSHAHVHALPIHVDMVSHLKRDAVALRTQNFFERPTDIDEAYLMVIDEDLVAHYFAANSCDRQYLRTLYSRLVAKPNARDWFANINIEETTKSVFKMKQLFS